MKGYYSINYSSLALQLTPVLLRNETVTALLISLAKPFNDLHGIFDAYVQSLSTSINAQTCYMRTMLNNRFDSTGRRIIVRTVSFDSDRHLLWIESQNKPLAVAKEGTDSCLLNRDNRLGENNIDFEIVLPAGLALDDVQLRQLQEMVNKNKLASKKYQIVYE
jgi:hypothetical protein